MLFFRKTQILARLLALLLLVTALPVSAEGELELASEAAVLIDADTGQVLYDKNAHQQMYPASITKIMTGMLALENLSPDAVVTLSQAGYNAVSRTSSHVSIEPGEEMTVEQAMYALALESANDAANMLAEGVSGSLEAFAQKMTQTAYALGAVDTQFANANGLPDSNHYTTAYDMALIAAAALKTPGFTDYFSALNYECPATNRNGVRSFHNRNRMLSGAYRYDGVLMSKTGWTSSAQGTLVTAVQKDGITLIAVVLKSIMTVEKYEDTWKLLDYGFSQYGYQIVTGEQIAASIETGTFVPLRNQRASYLLPSGTDVSQITFSLAEGMDLSSSRAEQTAVIINAFLGDAQLADTTLIMVQEALENEIAEAMEPPAEETLLPMEDEPPQIPWGQAAVAALAVAALLFGPEVSKRRRRKKNEKKRAHVRIQRMKDQINGTDT